MNTPILHAHLRGIRTRQEYDTFRRQVQEELNLVQSSIENDGPFNAQIAGDHGRSQDSRFISPGPTTDRRDTLTHGNRRESFPFRDAVPNMSWDNLGHFQPFNGPTNTRENLVTSESTQRSRVNFQPNLNSYRASSYPIDLDSLQLRQPSPAGYTYPIADTDRPRPFTTGPHGQFSDQRNEPPNHLHPQVSGNRDEPFSNGSLRPNVDPLSGSHGQLSDTMGRQTVRNQFGPIESNSTRQPNGPIENDSHRQPDGPIESNCNRQPNGPMDSNSHQQLNRNCPLSNSSNRLNNGNGNESGNGAHRLPNIENEGNMPNRDDFAHPGGTATGRSSRHHSTLIDDSDEEGIQRVYNMYAVPTDRHVCSQNNSHRQQQDRNDVFIDSRVPVRGSNQNHTHCSATSSQPIWQFRGPEIKLKSFSGNSEDYYEWKTSFRAQVDSYPEELKVSTLKDHLNEDSLAFVAFISATESGAYQAIWRELDKKAKLGAAPYQLYTGKLMELINGPRAFNVKGLEKVYNTLNFTWSKLCSLGGKYVGYAEPMLLGVSNILFDQSQRAVDKLSRTNRLNVPNVLEAVWEHMEQLSTRQHNEKAYGQQNAPQSTRNQHNRYPDRSTSSGQLYKVMSDYNRPDNILPERPIGIKTSNIIASPSRSVSPNKGQLGIRSFSPNKNRPQRSSSPNRRKAFKCSLCECNDHSHLDCNKFSPEDVLRMCKERHLCYVCRTTGHGASYCPFTPLLCIKQECENLPPHCSLLCDVPRRQ